MATIVSSASSAVASGSIVTATYGSVSDADIYFNGRSDWVDQTTSNKEKALWNATRAIDQLKFKDAKLLDDQILEFPRTDQLTVPDDIKYACYEEALLLIKGIDPRKELNNQYVQSHTFDFTKTSYKERPQEHIINGIMSPRAWALLRPYLVDGRCIVLHRTH